MIWWKRVAKYCTQKTFVNTFFYSASFLFDLRHLKLSTNRFVCLLSHTYATALLKINTNTQFQFSHTKDAQNVCTIRLEYCWFSSHRSLFCCVRQFCALHRLIVLQNTHKNTNKCECLLLENIFITWCTSHFFAVRLFIYDLVCVSIFCLCAFFILFCSSFGRRHFCASAHLTQRKIASRWKKKREETRKEKKMPKEQTRKRASKRFGNLSMRSLLFLRSLQISRTF